MNGALIGETPYDLRWRMFGFPIRIHPSFWIGSALLSWSYLEFGLEHVLLAVLCALLSILLHELGHALTFRWFGSDSEVVLYAMGGLAISDREPRRRWQRIVVSLAGPIAQFALFGFLWLLLPVLPKTQEGLVLTADYVPRSGRGPYFPLLGTFLSSMLFINLIWPLLNLLPIWPLDGGKVSRELFTAGSKQNGVRLSLQVSIAVAACCALYVLLAEKAGYAIPGLEIDPVNAILFVILIAICVQALQVENAHERWREDRWN